MKNIYKIALIVISVMLLYFFISTFLFLKDPDIEDVKLEGYVYSEINNSPINKCKIAIFNSTYKSRDSGYTDYSSYLGNDTIYVLTNKNGYYSTVIRRSAFIYLRAYKKNYKIGESEGLYSKKEMKQNFILKKGESKESDLLITPKVIEIIHN